MVVVPTWHPPGGTAPPEALLAALRRAHHDGAVVVGLCLGAFVVAAAGLLEGRRATTHWAYADALAALYPHTRVDGAALYVDEGSVLTSAGSAAGIDACLHLLRRTHGAAVAATVARALVVARTAPAIRPSSSPPHYRPRPTAPPSTTSSPRSWPTSTSPSTWTPSPGAPT